MQFICASCDDAVDCRYAMLPASCSCTLMPSCVLVARMPIFVCAMRGPSVWCKCALEESEGGSSLAHDLYGEGEYVKFGGHASANRSGKEG